MKKRKAFTKEGWEMKKLYEIEGTVSPTCARSQVTFSMYLPENYERLHFHFNYSPKDLLDLQMSKKIIEESLCKYGILEECGENSNWEKYVPLKNHLTLSFDDPEKFRGATHRHDSTLHLILSETEASPGLIPGKNNSGLWKVTISMHAVVTNECSYQLKVLGEV